jgi:hypothetical protein
MCKFLHQLSRYCILHNLIFPALTLSLTLSNFRSLLQQMEPTPSQVRNHYSRKNQEACLERALTSRNQPIIVVHQKFAFQLSAFLNRIADDWYLRFQYYVRMTRPMRTLVLTTVWTMESPSCHPTSKNTMWIIYRRSFIAVRHAGISHYALQGFHPQRIWAMPILSLHALRFQILDIYLRQWHYQSSNAHVIPPQQIIRNWPWTTGASQPVEWRPD